MNATAVLETMVLETMALALKKWTFKINVSGP